MNVIVIEDEKLSADHLVALIKKVDPTISVIARFDSVKKSIEEFNKGLKADLLFVDIHLADGLSFDIFSKISIDTPVIFTTAYNEYAIKAFEINSVDYLLKPIGIEELRRAIEKFKKLNGLNQALILENISKTFIIGSCNCTVIYPHTKHHTILPYKSTISFLFNASSTVLFLAS